MHGAFVLLMSRVIHSTLRSAPVGDIIRSLHEPFLFPHPAQKAYRLLRLMPSAQPIEVIVFMLRAVLD